MRLFSYYSPLLIAKHIIRLFTGRIYIKGRGRFDFNNGFLQIPNKAKEKHYKTVCEINLQIKKLKAI